MKERSAGKPLESFTPYTRFDSSSVDQADVSKITQGRSTGFSLRRLVRLLNRLDRDVELVVKPSRAKGRATFVVRAA